MERNRLRIRTSIAVTSACLLALAANARAQSAEAQARFDDGVRLMKDGKLDEACAAFETSNRLEPRAGTLIRLGQCREANQQLASAWSAYQDSLTKATDPKKKAFASGRVKAIEPKLSHLTLKVTRRVSGLAIAREGEPVDEGLWNVAVPVDGGVYTITASAPGHVAWKGNARVPVEGGNVTVDIPALAEDKAPPSPPTNDVTKPPEPRGDEESVDQPEPQDTFTGRRKVALAVLGVGVVAAGVGVVLGVSSNDKRDQAYALCPDPDTLCARAAEANTLISSAHNRAYAADAAFAVGGVAAVIAAVLWFTGAPERNVRVEARASSTGGGLAVVGSF